MKITIHQREGLQETEVIIRCAKMEPRIRDLAEYIRQSASSLEGRVDDATYYVPLDSILYIDSVEKKTFFYDKDRVYHSQFSLHELEGRLGETVFVRINKACIVNLFHVDHTIPRTNRRLELVMTNGERLMVTRTYFNQFKQRNEVYRNGV